MLFELRRCQNFHSRRRKFSRQKILHIKSHQRGGVSSNRQFREMVIALVRQIGPPKKPDLHPQTNGGKIVQQLGAFFCRQRAILPQIRTAQNIAVFQPKRLRHQWFVRTPQAAFQNQTARARPASQCRDKNIRILNDSHRINVLSLAIAVKIISPASKEIPPALRAQPLCL